MSTLQASVCKEHFKKHTHATMAVPLPPQFDDSRQLGP